MTHSMKPLPIFAAALAAGLLLASGATAQGQRPPKPDFAALASAVGTSEEAMAQCMRRPEGKGAAPARGERPAPPKTAEIAACLAKAGHSVDGAKLEAALKAAAPKPER